MKNCEVGFELALNKTEHSCCSCGESQIVLLIPTQISLLFVKNLLYFPRKQFLKLTEYFFSSTKLQLLKIIPHIKNIFLSLFTFHHIIPYQCNCEVLENKRRKWSVLSMQ